MTDEWLEKWCLGYYGSEGVGNCENCPHYMRCEEYIKTHKCTPLWTAIVHKERCEE